MSTKDKLIERFQSLPSDFTFDELKSVLGYYGFTIMNAGTTSGSRIFTIMNAGTTSGSRIRFKKGNLEIKMHKPHPGRIVGQKTLKSIRDYINSIHHGKTEI